MEMGLDAPLDAMGNLDAHEVARPRTWDFTGGATQIDPALGNPPLGRLAQRDRGLDRSPQSEPQLAWGADAASDEPTEDQLARLAGAVGPLRRVLAAIAERMIATKAHERLCYARLGDYARERPGLSARQLQELARVHRALAGLPALERALLANQLPWSKVRLLARVATEQDEHAWIARARAMPTRRLEQQVRESTQSSESEDPDEALPEKRVTLR